MPPSACQGVDQPVTPVRRVEDAVLFQDFWPVLCNDLQEIQSQLPMRGVFFRDQALKFIERHTLGMNLVKQQSKFPRELNRPHKIVGTVGHGQNQPGK